jgi:hypothetical protein
MLYWRRSGGGGGLSLGRHRRGNRFLLVDGLRLGRRWSYGDDDRLLWGRCRWNWRNWRSWRRRGWSDEFRMLLDDLLFEVFGGNLIQRTGCDPCGGKTQSFRLGENHFVLQAEFL